MAKKLLFSELLGKLDTLNESLYFCLPHSLNFVDLNTECLLLDDQEMEDQSKFGEFDCYGGLDFVKDIIDNLKQQVGKFDTKQAISAIDFYIKNDAFIKVEK